MTNESTDQRSWNKPQTLAKPSVVRIGGCIFALLSVSSSSYGGDWTITPRVTVREVYSDNINLSATNEESEFITDISPGLSVRGRGRRLQLNLDYNLQALYHAGGSAADRINNQLDLTGTGEVVEDRFFVDVAGSVRQENVSNRGSTATNSTSASGNLADTFVVDVSPYYRQRFGRYAQGEVRYRFDLIDNEGVNTGGDGNTISASLQSGPEFQKTPWNLFYSREERANDAGPDTTFQRINGTGRYRINRKYGLVGSMGYEDNSFSARSGTDAVTWSIGGTWTPTPRTSVEGGLDHRFFGTGYFLNASHRARRSVFTVTYDEDSTTTAQEQRDRRLVRLVDAFGRPQVTPRTDTLGRVATDAAAQTNEVFVQKRLTSRATFEGRRTSLGIEGYGEEREFQSSGDNEEVFGFSSNLRRQLSRDTSAGLSGGWQKTDFRDGVNATRWDVGMNVEHQFFRNVTGGVDLQHLTRESDLASEEFDENRVSVRVLVTF